jgi:hypothetical protein
LSYTYPSNSSNKKTGNNTLFLIAGALTIILIVLIFWGNTNESSVDQLVQSAAPDSSAFASQELVSPVEIENSEILKDSHDISQNMCFFISNYFSGRDNTVKVPTLIASPSLPSPSPSRKWK